MTQGAEQILRQISNSSNIRFGITAPYSAISEPAFRRVGFADIPVVQVSVTSPERGLAPIVRQHIFTRLTAMGLPTAGLAVTPMAQIPSRKRRFIDANNDSATHGKQKMGFPQVWRFEILDPADVRVMSKALPPSYA